MTMHRLHHLVQHLSLMSDGNASPLAKLTKRFSLACQHGKSINEFEIALFPFDSFVWPASSNPMLMKAEPECDSQAFIVRPSCGSLPQCGSPAPPVPASRSGVVT